VRTRAMIILAICMYICTELEIARIT
jgi:hypothetical protein